MGNTLFGADYTFFFFFFFYCFGCLSLYYFGWAFDVTKVTGNAQTLSPLPFFFSSLCLYMFGDYNVIN